MLKGGRIIVLTRLMLYEPCTPFVYPRPNRSYEAGGYIFARGRQHLPGEWGEKPAIPRTNSSGSCERPWFDIALSFHRPARRICPSDTPWSSACLTPFTRLGCVFFSDARPAALNIFDVHWSWYRTIEEYFFPISSENSCIAPVLPTLKERWRLVYTNAVAHYCEESRHKDDMRIIYISSLCRQTKLKYPVQASGY